MVTMFGMSEIGPWALTDPAVQSGDVVLSKDESFHFFRRNFSEISGFGGRRYERGGRNVDGRNFAKFRLKSAKKLPKNGCRRKIGEIFKK